MIPISKPVIGDAEKQAVLDVLDSGMLVQGPRVAELEARFAVAVGVKHAVATSNGTTALHLALLAHGVGPGDEVITTPFTFIASTNSILYVGAIPVFVDIEADTFNIDASAIEQAITPRTKAILPVHLYGQPCDMDTIMSIAQKHGLAVIEDCAQAIGATFRSQAVGSFGTGTFSLYATKNVMSGEGGIVTTNDDDVADRVRLIRGHGMRRRYHHEMLGYNFRLSDLHAAIGIAQMGRLAAFTERRQVNAAYLSERIRSVITPTVRPDRQHVWHQYTVRINRERVRDAAVQQLSAAGIGTGIFYPIPVHQHDHVRAVAGDVRLRVAEKLAGEVVSLPVHPSLTFEELEAIVEAVNAL